MATVYWILPFLLARGWLASYGFRSDIGKDAKVHFSPQASSVTVNSSVNDSVVDAHDEIKSFQHRLAQQSDSNIYSDSGSIFLGDSLLQDNVGSNGSMQPSAAKQNDTSDALQPAQLKPVSEASKEQVEEILSKFFEKAKEPDNLSRFQETAKNAVKEALVTKNAVKEANDDQQFTRYIQVVHFLLLPPLLDSILSPILRAHGFEATSMKEFMRERGLAAASEDPKCKNYLEEITKLIMGDVSALKADAGAVSEDAAVVSEASTKAVAELMRSFLLKVYEVENLSRIEQAFAEVKKSFSDRLQAVPTLGSSDRLKAVQTLVHPVFDSILSPLLHAKGFNGISLMEFVTQIYPAATRDPRCMNMYKEIKQLADGDWYTLRPVNEVNLETGLTSAESATSTVQLTSTVTRQVQSLSHFSDTGHPFKALHGTLGL